MDPDEALRQAINGLDTGDHETAIEAFNNYTQWVSRGGFPGDGQLVADVDRATTGWLDTDLHSPDGGWSS